MEFELGRTTEILGRTPGVLRGLLHGLSDDRAALEREGSLRSRSVPSAKGPPKRVYELTDAGHRRLREWIRREPRVPGAKLGYLAQLFSVTADERPRELAREIVESLSEEARRELAVLEAIDAQFRQVPGYPEGMPSFLFYPWLTLRHGLIRRRALVEWIDECRELLDRRSVPAGQDHDPEALTELVNALLVAADQTAAPKQPASED